MSVRKKASGTALLLVLTVIFAMRPFSQKQKPLDEKYLTGKYDFSESLAQFHGQKIKIPKVSKTFGRKTILGASNKKKVIEVDITNQKLYAYEGGTKIFDFTISTGKWNKTPIGIFRTWVKLKYTLMTGGSKVLGTYYYLPNVPFTMYFYNDETAKNLGYGIHGAYWHNNFGQPMSHGCINLKVEDAEKLFYWANPSPPGDNAWAVYASKENPGTQVIIYGEYQKEGNF